MRKLWLSKLQLYEKKMWRNSNVDAVINVAKYRRILKGDVTYTTSGNSSYHDWEDDTAWETSTIRNWLNPYNGGMNQKGTY
ncbi:MAG: hypothetical protein K2M60_04855 [Lachnospiraceae bacterium]|nr:hypothetical protein [Lachnospiraceae bacterium]MDE6251904.1 hypothetical protein [Lachnospiraceae bacterium]